MKSPCSFTKFAFLGMAVFVAVLSACFLMPASPAYAEDEPSVAVITATVDLKSSDVSFSVPISFYTGSYAVSSVSFELDYNQTCVRIANVTDFTGYPSGFAHSEVINADTGILQVPIWKQTDPQVALSNGTLVTVTYTLEAACSTDIPTLRTTIFTITDSPFPTFGLTDGIGSRTGISSTGTYTLDRNQAPTEITFSGTVNENVSGLRNLGTLDATDADGTDVHTFALAGSCTGTFNNEGFSINTDDATKLMSDRTFNFESAPSYILCIQANDGQGATYAGLLTISIGNVNDTPTDIALATAAVLEGADIGTSAGTFSTTDEDTGDTTFTYTKVAGTGATDNDQFTIDGSTLRTAATFNYDTKNEYKIRVQTSDGSATFVKQFTVRVIGKSLLVLPGETAMPFVVAGQMVTVPVNFTPKGNNVVAASLSITYNTDCLDYEGLDGLQSNFEDKSVADSNDDGVLTVAFDSSSATLAKGVIVSFLFEGVACTASESWTRVNFDPANPPVLTGASAVTFSSVTTNGRLVVANNKSRADCNSDGAINAGDFSATAIEIFDNEDTLVVAGVETDSWLYSPLGTFPGSARGCDSNNDTKVNVADVTCTARAFFGYGCVTPAVRAASAIPVVAAPAAANAVAGEPVAIPVQLTANGHALAAMAFTLDFDRSQFTFDAKDANGDGLPDGLTFSVPNNVYRMAMYDAANGRVQVLLTGLSMPLPLLPDGTVASIHLTGSATASGAASNLTLHDVSLGSTEGAAVTAEVTTLGAPAFSRTLFVPFILR